jgi:hypothetical protein
MEVRFYLDVGVMHSSTFKFCASHFEVLGMVVSSMVHGLVTISLRII